MIFGNVIKEEKRVLEEMSTDQMMSLIKEAPGYFSEKKLDLIENIQFEEYLGNLMEKYHCTPSHLIIRTCLSKPFVYQILKGERVPGRDVVIRICLALKVDVNEAQHLLMLSEKGSLYPKIKRDAAILCCIEGKKSLEYTNHFLEEHGEKKLL